MREKRGFDNVNNVNNKKCCPTWTSFRQKASSPSHSHTVDRRRSFCEPNSGSFTNAGDDSGPDPKLRVVCAEVEVSDDGPQIGLADRRGRRVLTVGDAQLDVVAAVVHSDKDSVPEGVV